MYLIYMFRALCLITLCGLLVACGSGQSSNPSDKQDNYPKTWKDRQLEDMGKLTGEDGIVLFGGKSKSTAATQGINVNSYLWRASLDVVHKMPLVSADPFGGVILTDWYLPSENSKERYKLSIYVVGAELRSDAVRVAAFKQTLDKKGNWGEAIGSDALATEIENKILLKARAIKYKSAR
jgi:hypothetical protein